VDERVIIAQAPRYTVDRTGVVRCGERVIRGRHGIGGYVSVALSVGPNKRRRFLVHRLVCEAFNGPQPDGSRYVRHLDGNPANNVPENVAWGTHLDNMRDRDRHGRTARGEAQAKAKLTTSQVISLRTNVASGMTTKEASQVYGISQMQASHIATGRAWKSVGGPRSRRGRFGDPARS